MTNKELQEIYSIGKQCRLSTEEIDSVIYVIEELNNTGLTAARAGKNLRDVLLKLNNTEDCNVNTH